MFVLITYDIEKDRPRTRLAKALKNFGPRVQKSVFEADVGEEELVRLQDVLEKIALQKEDSIRLYVLCASCSGKIRIWGKGEVTRDEDYYIA